MTMSEKKKNSIRLKMSPERKAAFKKRMLKERASLTLPYQLGHYVGEDIVRKYLPTLSVDSLQTKTVITTTPEEEAEAKRLNNIWFGKVMSFKGTDEDKHKVTKPEWDALRAYHEMLEEKYLPKTIECHIAVLNITQENMKEFKMALGSALWNCDCSHYSCNAEDIDVKADEDGWFTIITIKRA